MGKTLLALEASGRVADQFPDGVTVVDLAPVRESRFVLPAIAQALGLRDLGTRSLTERLQEYLRERDLLLILDNFEQVLPAAVELTEILATCPGLRILATSRVPLRLDEDDPEPSFGMLETMRQYAGEQLEAQRELDAAGRAHAQYFLELAERADPHLRMHGQRAWYVRLEEEHDNLRAALRWLLDHDDPESALHLAAALGDFWWRRGYHAEGVQWLEETLREASGADAAIRTMALLRAGLILEAQGETDRAKPMLQEALALAQQRSDRSSIAQSLTYLGFAGIWSGEWTESRRLMEEGLRHAEELRDDYQIAQTLALLAYIPFIQGDFREAAALMSGSLTHYQAIEDLASAALSQFNLASMLGQLGDLARSVQLVRDGLQTSLAFRDRYQLCQGVEAVLLVVRESADPAKRARLLGAGDALNEATGSPFRLVERAPGGIGVGLREQLEREELGTAYQEGRSLSFEDIVTLAREVLDEFAQALPTRESVQAEPVRENPLSGRELEVLHMVAEGRTSKQIGQQLFLSHRTVDHHLTSIFNKLGVDTRAQAVAVAAREGLL